MEPLALILSRRRLYAGVDRIAHPCFFGSSSSWSVVNVTAYDIEDYAVALVCPVAAEVGRVEQGTGSACIELRDERIDQAVEAGVECSQSRRKVQGFRFTRDVRISAHIDGDVVSGVEAAPAQVGRVDQALPNGFSS